MLKIFATLSGVLFGILLVSNAAAQSTDTSLYYFDQNTNLNVFFPLPGTFGTTSGADVARTIVAYSERFSSPWPLTYVKSVSVAMRVDKLEGGAVIPVELRKATTIGGRLFADMSAAPLERQTIEATDVESGKLSYDKSFGQAPMEATFFVAISAPDTAHTRASLRADSHVDSAITVQPKPIDDSDRAQFYLDAPYHDTLAWYIAGTQWPFLSGVYDYSNFVISAEVVTPTGGVAQLYPASSDPLQFIVETVPSGDKTLHYALSSTAHVSIIMYDTRGSAVATLLDGHESAGQHELRIASSLPSGMYYAKLSANGVSEVRPVAIAR
jgi:hypothetical protein